MASLIPKKSNRTKFAIDRQVSTNGEFSTAIKRFQDQINRQVLFFMERNNLLSVSVLPSDQTIFSQTRPSATSGGTSHSIILSETSHSLNTSNTMTFAVSALTVSSVEMTTQNLSFEIIGFGSAIVRITGEVNLAIAYLGVDLENYNENLVLPFSFIETIPGDYPSNAYATGNVVVHNMVNKMDEDPCNISVAGMSIQLFMTADIRIVIPA